MMKILHQLLKLGEYVVLYSGTVTWQGCIYMHNKEIPQ